MDVLCVDKTGTITTNRLSVTDVVPLNAFTREDVLEAGALASEKANQDAIDLAVLAAARQPDIRARLAATRSIAFTPFDAKTRRTEALVETLLVFGYAMICSLGVNDLLKVVLIRQFGLQTWTPGTE